MARYEHLPIYKTTYDLFLNVLQMTKSFPKDYRYTLGEHFHLTAIKLLKQVYLTNNAKDKVESLQLLLSYIQEMGVLIRAAHDLKILGDTRFFDLIQKRDSLEKQTTGWLKSFESKARVLSPV